MIFSRTKNVESSFLKIHDNCLEIENTMIQLSNISLISSADVTPEKFLIYSIALISLGSFLSEHFTFPALIAIVLGGIWIYFWYTSVQEVKEMKRLTIITNSGHAFPIIFENQAFLDKVLDIMKDNIRDPAHVRNMTINIKECTFSDDASVIENMHER